MKRFIGTAMAVLGAFGLGRGLASGELLEPFMAGGADIIKGLVMLAVYALLLFFGFKLAKTDKKKDAE